MAIVKEPKLLVQVKNQISPIEEYAKFRGSKAKLLPCLVPRISNICINLNPPVSINFAMLFGSPINRDYNFLAKQKEHLL